MCSSDLTINRLPKERVEFQPWVPTPALPYKLAILDVDVAMIPLGDTPFNSRKSAIKWIEYAALEVPAVTSLVSPYKEMATEKNGVFIEGNTPTGWSEGIQHLLSRPLDRAAMGYAARKTVEEHCDIDKEIWRWDDAYRGVLATAGVR